MVQAPEEEEEENLSYSPKQYISVYTKKKKKMNKQTDAVMKPRATSWYAKTFVWLLNDDDDDDRIEIETCVTRARSHEWHHRNGTTHHIFVLLSILSIKKKRRKIWCWWWEWKIVHKHFFPTLSYKWHTVYVLLLFSACVFFCSHQILNGYLIIYFVLIK